MFQGYNLGLEFMPSYLIVTLIYKSVFLQLLFNKRKGLAKVIETNLQFLYKIS